MHMGKALRLWLGLVLLSLLHGCTTLGLSSLDKDYLTQKYTNSESKFVEVDGIRIHYRIEGQGEPIVLLHGVLSSLHTWDGWTEALSPHYQVIRIDVPGFGLTGAVDPDFYLPENSAAWLAKLLDKLQIERAHFAGNSLGGYLSWNFAAYQPQRVNKLILLDPASYPHDLPWIMSMLNWPVVGNIGRVTAPRFLVDMNLKQVYGDASRIQPGVLERYHELLLYPGNRGAMVDIFKVLKQAKDENSLHLMIPKIQAPTLLMWGEQDRWIPPSLISRWLDDLPNLQLITYPSVGHIPMEEIPQISARDALAFLQGAKALTPAKTEHEN